VFFDTIIEAKEFDTTVHIQSEGRKQDGGGTAKCSTAQDFTCGVGGRRDLLLPGWRLPTAWEMSFFLMVEFQKFFTSLSVLPGRCLAIWAHL
jgi:hypothetical protein